MVCISTSMTVEKVHEANGRLFMCEPSHGTKGLSTSVYAGRKDAWNGIYGGLAAGAALGTQDGEESRWVWAQRLPWRQPQQQWTLLAGTLWAVGWWMTMPRRPTPSTPTRPEQLSSEIPSAAFS